MPWCHVDGGEWNKQTPVWYGTPCLLFVVFSATVTSRSGRQWNEFTFVECLIGCSYSWDLGMSRVFCGTEHFKFWLVLWDWTWKSFHILIFTDEGPRVNLSSACQCVMTYAWLFSYYISACLQEDFVPESLRIGSTSQRLFLDKFINYIWS